MGTASEQIGDLQHLATALALDPSVLDSRCDASPAFPLRVPAAFVDKMRPGDADDPLLRQVLPDRREAEVTPGETPDPVGDLPARLVPGLLHKYPGRALIVTTGACPVHCRYCFRRQFDYRAGQLTPSRLDAVIEALASDGSIREVILSGGDPLSLSDAKLSALIQRLASIESLETLRIHTRYPVVDPARVTAGLVRALRGWDRSLVVVVHANHPEEIDAAFGDGIAKLREVPATLLNQSVLLREVNDDAAVLADLSERLFRHGVLPYYLHMLDRVEGTSHFTVDDARGMAIVDTMRARLPGYLVPRLVREVAGAPGKLPVGDPG